MKGQVSMLDHVYFQLYEGLKAYRGGDNKVRIFRPDLNMERMYSTAERAMLPVSEHNVNAIIAAIVACCKKCT